MATTIRAASFRSLSLLLLVLLLAAGLPGRAIAESPVTGAGGVPDKTLAAAACRAVQFLHRAQKADGGFGVTAVSSAAATADTTYVLALLGENVNGPAWTTASGKTPLEALEALTIAVPPTAPGWATVDPGQAGKVARAVAMAGGNSRNFGGVDLVATIQGFYDASTGLYHPTFLYRHSLAIEGLWRSGAPVPAAAYDALLASQVADGGWFWSKGTEQSDVDTTGRVLQVLGGIGHVQASAAYSEAAQFLAGQQLSGGGWNTGPQVATDPANANSTALAVGGLIAIGQDPQAAEYSREGRGALETLLSFQEPSGAFVYIRQAGKEESRVMATADALAVLAPLLEGQTICQPIYLPMILVR